MEVKIGELLSADYHSQVRKTILDEFSEAQVDLQHHIGAQFLHQSRIANELDDIAKALFAVEKNSFAL